MTMHVCFHASLSSNYNLFTLHLHTSTVSDQMLRVKRKQAVTAWLQFVNLGRRHMISQGQQSHDLHVPKTEQTRDVSWKFIAWQSMGLDGLSCQDHCMTERGARLGENKDFK